MGVYDAPLRPKDSTIPLSSLALNLGEQIKVKQNTLDSVLVHLATTKEAPEAEEQKVREVGSDEEADGLAVVTAYACQGINHTKKVKCETAVQPDEMINELTTSKSGHDVLGRQYLAIVDFDEHLADIALDWTNPEFND